MIIVDTPWRNNTINYKTNQAIEFPNNITESEINNDIIVPFELGVGLEQVTANFHFGKRNIINDIKNYSKEPYNANKFHIISRNNNNDLMILYKGDIFLNIPIRMADVRPDGKIKLTIDLIKGRSLDKTFDLNFNINLEPWKFSADFSKHELVVGETIELVLLTINQGIKGHFYIDSKLIDSYGDVIKYQPIEYSSDFELDFNEKKEMKFNIHPFNKPGNYVIDLAVVKRIEYLAEEHNKNWRDNYVVKKYYFCVKDNGKNDPDSLDVEIKKLLDATIAKSESERRGSVLGMIKQLNNANHEQIIEYYISHLPDLIDNNCQDEVYNATVIISKLDTKLYAKHKRELEKIYKRIYGSADWQYTSSKYEYIKQYF